MTDLNQIDCSEPILSPSELADYRMAIRLSLAKRNAIEARMREARIRGYEARNPELIVLEDDVP